MLVQDLLRRAANAAPDAPAIAAGETAMTFAELDRRSDALAAALQARGLRKTDRLAAAMDNSPDFILALWAALKAGAIFVPINPGFKSAAVAAILRDAEPSCVIAPPALAEAVASAPRSAAKIWTGGDADGERFADLLAAPGEAPRPVNLIDVDLAFLIYTSGSTGAPKGVMMSHQTMCNNAAAIAHYLEARSDDAVLCALPLTSSYGLCQVLTAAHAGHRLVIERAFIFANDILKRIAAEGVTGMPGVPTMFARLIEALEQSPLDLPRLRYVTNAAAPLAPAHVQRLRALLPQTKIYSMYGLTECTRVSYLDPAKIDAKPSSSGAAMPNCEIRIVDEDGRACAPGEAGELVVRGANLMRGYWRKPEETARALRPGPFPGEQVLHTGDLFYTDADGDLHFVGRLDDVFKSRGQKVSPREVENALYEIDGVAEAAVIGAPDEIDGMAIVAYIVAREGAGLTEQAVRRHCAARLAAWLTPKTVIFCASLPKTESGKISARALRTAHQAG